MLQKLSTFTKPVCLGVLACFTLTACQNIFNKEPVVQPKYQPDLVLGEMQTLTIGASRIPCQYASLPMQCLLAQTTDNKIFEIPYNYINDFNPVKGVIYQINVRPFIDNNKQAQTGRWQLDSVVSQQTANK